jgi:histidyl-tRNA synthetase
MVELLSAVKGMDDLFESDLATWRHVEHIAQQTFLAYGFGEVRTPILEDTALFVRGVGETSDIVHKEMFAFDDMGSAVCLRPENTAGVVRALLQAGKVFADAYEKVFYTGAMFRREQPQAGRRRQFHQLGCEALGYAEPAMDVEVITLVHTLLGRLGLAGHVKLVINSLGDAADRPAYGKALVDYFSQHEAKLSDDSRRRLRDNPLRILDSKDPRDQVLARSAPRTLDFLGADARIHFDAVQAGLTRLAVPFVVDSQLVRGLEYYTRTVFEFVGEAGLGAQSTVAAGGRYDGLVETLGGRPTPAVGFAGGIERLIMMMKAVQVTAPSAHPQLMLIGVDDDGKAICERLAHGLRGQGLRVAVDVRGRGMKAQLKTADKSGTTFAMIIGGNEVSAGKAVLKRLSDGSLIPEVSLSIDAIAAAIR